MRIGIVRFMFLALLALPLVLTAAQLQDRDWGDQGYNDNQRLNAIARRLSNRADDLWNMVRYRSEFRDPQRRYFRDAVREFAGDARQYRLNPSDWRARKLIERAEDISRFVDRTGLPYDFQTSWFRVEQQVSRLSQYYGFPFDRNRNLARTPYDNGQPFGGVFRWRGRVDGTDVVFLHGNQIQIDHRQARSITDSSFDLSSPLPRNPVNVQLQTFQGRGRVQVIQQPSASNNFAAGVLIEDDAPGADFYEFELRW